MTNVKQIIKKYVEITFDIILGLIAKLWLTLRNAACWGAEASYLIRVILKKKGIC